jgi:hypothetical protein
MHRRMVGRPAFRRLDRGGPGRLTVTHVPASGPPEAARTAAFEWGRAVWESYDAEHATVRAWLREVGYEL